MRVSKRWKKFHFGVSYSLNMLFMCHPDKRKSNKNHRNQHQYEKNGSLNIKIFEERAFFFCFFFGRAVPLNATHVHPSSFGNQ